MVKQLIQVIWSCGECPCLNGDGSKWFCEHHQGPKHFEKDFIAYSMIHESCPLEDHKK